MTSLDDRVDAWWSGEKEGGETGLLYAASVLFPPVGLIAGVVRAERGRVGPALAIWTASAAAAACWAAGILAAVVR